jgi:hypothetical protein
LDACGRDLIPDFFSRFEVQIHNCSSLLIFGCEETILECSDRSKIIDSAGTQEGISNGRGSFPHITAMIAHSMIGKALPPFVLFSCMAELPRFERD